MVGLRVRIWSLRTRIRIRTRIMREAVVAGIAAKPGLKVWGRAGGKGGGGRDYCVGWSQRQRRSLSRSLSLHLKRGEQGRGWRGRGRGMGLGEEE